MQWKQKLQVPPGIRYLGDWREFTLRNFRGHNILHKQLPGCGFTEFALTCPEPVVLCSPRKMLMENKKNQHGDDVYLVVNESEAAIDIDEDISKPILSLALEKKDEYFQKMLEFQTQELDNIYTKLFNEISGYIRKMREEYKPIKIIVTYDSADLTKRILESLGIIQDFWFCVDEFQSILDDARFKSSTELEFLSVLKNISNVLYVSATPMLDKYLERIQELNLIPYFELDWKTLDPTRIKKSNLKVRTMKSMSGKMSEIIQTYLEGNYEKAIVERGGELVEIESKEAVFYVNSVNHIINIIKKMGLGKDQVNILCSDTPFNQSRIDKKLGKKSGFKIGEVPLRGQPHKMFTFCTRTVFLGADFYSTCARSFIFSDSNSDCLSVDISMDLYQILGRERLDENPWKNCAEFYYRTTCDYKKMTQEDLDSRVQVKIEKTNNLLLSYNSTPTNGAKNSLAEVYQREAKSIKYRENYVAVNKDKSTGNLFPVLNNLVLINEQRSFDIQQIDYADRFAVFTSLDREFNDAYVPEERFINLFFSDYDSFTTYVEKIHYIVDNILRFPQYRDAIVGNLADSDKIKQQLLVLGPEKIKGLGYHLTKINQAMGITIFDKTTFMEEIYSNFIPGQRYTKKFIKEKLGEIYRSADFKGTPKASDLEEWFEIKESKVYVDKKQIAGFEIIKKK